MNMTSEHLSLYREMAMCQAHESLRTWSRPLRSLSSMKLSSGGSLSRLSAARLIPSRQSIESEPESWSSADSLATADAKVSDRIFG